MIQDSLVLSICPNVGALVIAYYFIYIYQINRSAVLDAALDKLD